MTGAVSGWLFDDFPRLPDGLGTARKSDCIELLDREHYLGGRCAEPTMVYCDIVDGEIMAAALFNPPAAYAWGPSVVELGRLVRSADYDLPLSRLIAAACRAVKARGRFDAVLSYADPSAGHHGGIYQASNFWFIGMSSKGYKFKHKASGRLMSRRSFDQSSEDYDDWVKIPECRKFTYIRPLTKDARRRYADRQKPYPKPAGLHD